MRKKKKGSVSVSKQELERLATAERQQSEDFKQKPPPELENFEDLFKLYQTKHTATLWEQHAVENLFAKGATPPEVRTYPEGAFTPPARLPTDSAERKNIPIASGVLDYFPDALAAVAAVSKAGNDQHNPGEPLHWARGKSMDQGDTLIRHFLERGTIDVDGLRHSAKMVWRALALLQLEIEQEKGLPPSRGSK